MTTKHALITTRHALITTKHELITTKHALKASEPSASIARTLLLILMTPNPIARPPLLPLTPTVRAPKTVSDPLILNSRAPSLQVLGVEAQNLHNELILHVAGARRRGAKLT